jgi:Zn-dependent M28 family amino/carboxypeptidase
MGEDMDTKKRPLLRQSAALVSAVALALVAAFISPATAVPPPGEIEQTRGFRKAVTVQGIRQHQQAFQGFADAFGGNRVSGGAGGFDASAQYVYDRMAAAGYNVSFQEFTFTFVGDRTPPILEKVSPEPAKAYVDGVDFATMSYSGSGDFTAQVVAVDLVVPAPGPGATTSGCESADFAGFPAGAIALVQRGTCTFRMKAENAQAAGASAAIVFNDGGDAGRTGVIFGTLNPPPMSLPVVGTTFGVGDELRNGVLNGPTGVTARVRTDVIAETRPTRNVIAETDTGDPNRVVVVGAHLDSVSRGPGINDNGSGSGTILEIAEEYAERIAEGEVPRNKLRFMWYGAEEFGLIGSTFYVNSLSAAQRDQIELMLNFDMVGSPNFVRFVYDGDNSTFVPPDAQVGPPGSGEIERVFNDYFDSQSLAKEATPFNGRSDYGPFIAQGIPAGGLFTGAEGVKTAEQANVYGGVAGQQYDPCYHLACDTFSGTGTPYALTGLDQMSDATAHAVLLFSRRNFALNPLAAPSAAAAEGRRAAITTEQKTRR